MGNRLVVVRPKEVPEGTEEKDIPTHVVGESWLRRWPNDFTLIRYVGETDEQVAEREKAEAEAAASAAAAPAPAPEKKTTEAPKPDRFAQQ